MKNFIAPVAALALLASTPTFAQPDWVKENQEAYAKEKIAIPDKPQVKEETEKVSYAMGLQYGASLKMAPIKFDINLVLAGLRDGAQGKAVMSDKDRDEMLSKFEKQMTERDAKESKERAEKNKKEGMTFLAENKKKEGVKSTPSGLQYKIIKEGSGASPRIDDSVEINYSGKLVSGQEFDSSYKRKRSSTVPLRGIIAGWSEALQMMKPGAKWEIYVPAELGYGNRGAGREVPPNATLIYEIELLSVVNSSAKK